MENHVNLNKRNMSLKYLLNLLDQLKLGIHVNNVVGILAQINAPYNANNAWFPNQELLTARNNSYNIIAKKYNIQSMSLNVDYLTDKLIPLDMVGRGRWSQNMIQAQSYKFPHSHRGCSSKGLVLFSEWNCK